MTARFVDTHFHLDLFENPVTLAREIEEAKVYTIAVTNAPSVFHYTEKLAVGKKYLRAAIGLHPELALAREGELPQMWECLERTRYVGEIGLDYKGLGTDQKKRQRVIFSSILERCAKFGDKILSIHSRGTVPDVLSALGTGFPGKVILHWYTGTDKNLSAATREGYYFSVNSKMVTSPKGRRIISEIPLEFLLTESDGPFISITGKSANPMCMFGVIEGIATIRSMSVDTVADQIFKNFRELLR